MVYLPNFHQFSPFGNYTPWFSPFGKYLPLVVCTAAPSLVLDCILDLEKEAEQMRIGSALQVRSGGWGLNQKTPWDLAKCG
jgi:hypothetical protein